MFDLRCFPAPPVRRVVANGISVADKTIRFL